MSNFPKFAIAAGHPETAQAGAAVLEAGGNAFDAAIAALLAAFVCESATISAGGGGFLLAHAPHLPSPVLFDFFVQTPRSKRLDGNINFYPVSANFGGARQVFHVGLAAIATPGNIAGMFHVHKRLGKMPFAHLAEPAIALAKRGVVLNGFQRVLTALLQPIVMASVEGRAIFATPDGLQLLSEGSHTHIAHLADTLEYLVNEGARAFYEGEIGQRLVRDCAEQGGWLTADDLKHYQVMERQPLSLAYRNRTILTNPPPSSGGTLIGFALQLLQSIPSAELAHGSLRHLQALGQVQILTNAARRSRFDAHLYDADLSSVFLSKQHLSPYIQTFKDSVLGSTTHISTIDRWGNAASLTTSSGVGNAYYIPKTGIMTNNMLGEEDLNPHGFHQWLCNHRLSSMMSPSLVFSEGKQLELVLGSSGANRIRSAILQTLCNFIDGAQPLDDSVQLPRLHVEDKVLNFEAGFDLNILSQMPLSDDEKRIWENRSMYFGGVNAVSLDAKGNLWAVADNRRQGVAICSA